MTETHIPIPPAMSNFAVTVAAAMNDLPPEELQRLMVDLYDKQTLQMNSESFKHGFALIGCMFVLAIRRTMKEEAFTGEPMQSGELATNYDVADDEIPFG